MPIFVNTSRTATRVIAAVLAVTASSPILAQGTPAAGQTAPGQSAPVAAKAAPIVPKEVALTEPQVQHVLDAQKDFDAIVQKMPKTETARPDPQIVTELESTARKHGFADYADYNNVVFTLSVVLNGFDPKTKTYVGPEAVLKQQLAAVQADSKIPANDKKAIVEEINAALKSPPPPVANTANVDLVAKYYDKIAASLQDE